MRAARSGRVPALDRCDARLARLRQARRRASSTRQRLAIDALGALVPLLEGERRGEPRRDLGQALANLQLAYADAVAAASQPDE